MANPRYPELRANGVWMSVRETAWLIARVRFGANYVHALHIEVAEDAVMPVTSIRFCKESEEEKHVAYGYAVLAEMGLSGTGLGPGGTPMGLQFRPVTVTDETPAALDTAR